MPIPWKNLIRSLAITFGGWAILPENNYFIWIVLANEGLKWYRLHKEAQEEEQKFKKAHEEFLRKYEQEYKNAISN